MTNCWYCNKPGSIVCDNPQCQQYDQELQASLDAEYQQQLRQALWAVIRQRAKGECDWQLSRLARWWYVCKLLLCVWLGLDEPGPGDYPECIEVACYHSAKLYAGWEADWIRVGRGVFTGWWFDLHHDGDWEM